MNIKSLHSNYQPVLILRASNFTINPEVEVDVNNLGEIIEDSSVDDQEQTCRTTSQSSTSKLSTTKTY